MSESSLRPRPCPALGFVPAREGIALDEVGPLQTTRHADDPAGAADLVRLVALLVRASARRSGR
ncbi:hypothetical protein [Streptomyces sp. NPDC096153]|uniref:hypothetical protein n=1 Tax=Streptomyces sp. NPDC096153 TaxID=3155548 RepID=UPI003324D7FF